MNIMKLVKLVYLLDRLSIQRRGIPVVGGTYFALPNGPITSELLDLINAGRLEGEKDCRWAEFIRDRQNHEVALIGEGSSSHLSESELALIEQVYEAHGAKDQWQLRDWTHQHCEEWTPLEQGRDTISIESIARALGMSEAKVQQIREDAVELRFVGVALGND
ncbi:MAG: Panacea domain-containing protein [Candidatus Sumerlaeota bacterium]|nr:Panacea domain-containing protein [Candidatus Sumerlaeota bacterium]